MVSGTGRLRLSLRTGAKLALRTGRAKLSVRTGAGFARCRGARGTWGSALVALEGGEHGGEHRLVADLGGKLTATANLADLSDAAAARNYLGLGGTNSPNGWVRLNDEGTVPPILIDSTIARDSEVTAAIEAAQYTDEQARDVVASALVAGSNITITVDDLANTITIGATSGSSETVYTTAMLLGGM